MGIGYQPDDKKNNNTYARKSQHNADSSSAVLVGDTHTHQTLAPAVTPPTGPAGPQGAPFLSSFSYGSTDDLRSLKGSGQLDLGPEEKCMVTGD